MNTGLLDRIAYRLPPRLRFRYFRQFGGAPNRWVQWIYDGEGEYSLKPMREKNCVFVHIPKAAGISLAHALFGGKGGAHASVSDYLSVFGADWYDQAYSFTFVRHPKSRLISAFDFLKKGGFHDDDKIFAEKELADFDNLNDFVLHGLNKPTIKDWPHFRPQTNFLIDPRTNKIGVRFIGRVETIDQDFAIVANKVGAVGKLEQKNAREAITNKTAFTLSDKAEEIMCAFYARDFDWLGYNKAQ